MPRGAPLNARAALDALHGVFARTVLACVALACGASAQAVWTGATNAHWNVAANWSTGVVPDSNTDVEIPAATPNSASTAGGGAVAKNVLVRSGATITIVAGPSTSLGIHGDWTVESGGAVAGGRVRMLGNGSVQLPNTPFALDLEIQASGVITCASPRVHVTGTLELSAGTLELASGNVTEIDGAATLSGGMLRASSGTPTLDLDGPVTLAGTTADSVLPFVSVSNDWTALNAAFAPSSGAITFDGTVPQVLAGPGLDFFDVLVAASANVSGSSGLHVGGAFVVDGSYTHLSPTGGLIVDGDVWVRGSGGSLGLGASGTSRFRRNVRVSGAIAAPGTVFFEPTGSTAGLTLDPGSSNTFGDVVIAGNDPFQIGAGLLLVTGDLSKTTGTELELAAGAIVSVAGAAQFLQGSVERLGAGALLDVSGAVTFSSTTVVTPPDVRAGGDFALDGSFSPTSGSVRFGGATPQSVIALNGVSTLQFFAVEVEAQAAVTTPVDLPVALRGSARVDGGLRVRGPTTIDAAVSGAASGDLELEHRLVARGTFVLQGELRTTDALAGIGIAPGSGGNDDDDEVVLDVADDLFLGGACSFGDGIHVARRDVTFGAAAAGVASGTGFEVLALRPPSSTTVVVRTNGVTIPVRVRVEGDGDDATIVLGATSDLVDLDAGLELLEGTLRANTSVTVRVRGLADFVDGVLADGTGSPLFDFDGPVRFEGSTDVSAPPDLACSDDWSSNASFTPLAFSTVTFDATGNQTLAQAGGYFRRLVVAPSATVCATTALVVGAPATTNGELVVDGSLAVTSTMTVHGTTVVSGTLQATAACPSLAAATGAFAFGSTVTVEPSGALVLGDGEHTFQAGLDALGTVASSGTLVLTGSGRARWLGCVGTVRVAAPGATLGFGSACIGGDLELATGTIELLSDAVLTVAGDFESFAGTALRGAATAHLDVGGAAHVLASVDAEPPGTLRFAGGLRVGNEFHPASGVVELVGSTATSLQRPGDAAVARFHELLVAGDVSPGIDLVLECARVEITAGARLSSGARRLTLASAASAFDIDVEGTLHVAAGGALELASAANVEVLGPQGVLDCIGTQAAPAVVTRTATDPGAGYALSIEAGATLRASYARFERMGAAGIRITRDALLGPAPHDLRRVVFDRPAAGPASALLDLARANATELRYVEFRDSGAGACDDGSSTASSVRCTSGASIRFVHWTCDFGPQGEDDPGSRLTWSAPESTVVSSFNAIGRERAIELAFTTSVEHDVDAFLLERLAPGGLSLATFELAPQGASTYTWLDAPLAPQQSFDYRLLERLTHGELRVLGSASATALAANVVFVDARASGSGDGSSWANAFTRLDAALTALGAAPAHVWIAAGRYTPSATADRGASFSLQSGRALIGGFGGFETSVDQRDPSRYRTVLSGDLLGDDALGLFGDNSLHVVRADGADASALLDGVHVEGGRADGAGIDAHGAGLLVQGGTPTIDRATFRDHQALGAGGAIHVALGGRVALTRSVCVANSAATGGAIALEPGASASIASTSFFGNGATSGGALALAPGASCGLVGAVFAGNTAATGAAIDAGAAADLLVSHTSIAANAAELASGGLHAPFALWSVENSIVYGNTAGGAGGFEAQLGTPTGVQHVRASCVEGAFTNTSGNLALDPRFQDLAGRDGIVGSDDDDLRLAHDSPCIGAANALLVPDDALDLDRDGDQAEFLPLDRAGRPRLDGPGANFDIGAYERAVDCDGDGSADETTAQDCDGNTHPDACDIADGIAADRDLDGRPDACASGVAFCSGDGTATACPCGNSSASGAGCANSLGTGARLEATGSVSLASDGLVLAASGMPDGTALYFQGSERANGGLGAVFGDGLRCAGGTIVRLSILTNVAGASQLDSHPTAPLSALGLVTAPGTRSYQVWYRNSATFCSAQPFNTTNGVEVDWRP